MQAIGETNKSQLQTIREACGKASGVGNHRYSQNSIASNQRRVGGNEGCGKSEM